MVGGKQGNAPCKLLLLLCYFVTQLRYVHPPSVLGNNVEFIILMSVSVYQSVILVLSGES